MGDTMEAEKPQERTAEDEAIASSNMCMVAGAGFSAYSASYLIAGSAVCPLCIVAAPTFFGIGIYKRYRARKAKLGKQ